LLLLLLLLLVMSEGAEMDDATPLNPGVVLIRWFSRDYERDEPH